MRNVEILDRDFNRLCFMTPDSEAGLNFYGDALSTTIDSGVYTLEFKVPKQSLSLAHSDKMKHLKEGNYLRFRNRQDVPILMTIKNITENRSEKHIYAEDTSLSLINSILEGVETPTEPQTLAFYLEPVLNRTGFYIGLNESDDKRIIDLAGNQNALERVRQIIHAFEMEFYFEVKFEDLKEPRFMVNVVDRRIEGTEGFRVSSDSLVRGMERTVNTDNIITKLYVRGSSLETETETTAEEAAEEVKEPAVDTFAEKAIAEAQRIASMRRRYQWGGNGNPSWDCSGYMQSCIQAAGVPVNHRATTYTMWSQQAPFKRISASELKRGDLVMYDTGYTHTVPNHVGMYLGNGQVQHAGDPVGIIQRYDSMKITGYVRVIR